MITLTTVETIVITYLPTIVSIISIFSALSIFINKFKTLATKKEIDDEKEALREQNKMILEEFRRCKKFISLYIEKTAKIKYKDMTEVKDDEDLQI